MRCGRAEQVGEFGEILDGGGGGVWLYGGAEFDELVADAFGAEAAGQGGGFGGAAGAVQLACLDRALARPHSLKARAWGAQSPSASAWR